MKRLILRPIFLLPILLLLALGASAFYLYPRVQRAMASPYRIGQALAPFPRPLALRVCKRLGAEATRCLEGYLRAKLRGPLEGDPLAPCEGLPSPFLQTCAAVQGARFHELSNPFGACARFIEDKGAYLSCAEAVGRKAFAKGGFDGPRGARETCAKGKGEAQVHCQVGAAKRAIERYGVGKLREAVQFCGPQNPLCAQGILEAIRDALPRKEALLACDLLPTPLSAQCVVTFRRP